MLAATGSEVRWRSCRDAALLRCKTSTSARSASLQCFPTFLHPWVMLQAIQGLLLCSAIVMSCSQCWPTHYWQIFLPTLPYSLDFLASALPCMMQDGAAFIRQHIKDYDAVAGGMGACNCSSR
jgi:hypothetical protein